MLAPIHGQLQSATRLTTLLQMTSPGTRLSARPTHRPSRQRLSTAAQSPSDSSTPPAGDASPPPSARPTAATADLLRYRAVPDVTMAKQLGLTEEHLNALIQLPGTNSIGDLRSRLLSLSQWSTSLRKGVLPAADGVTWPAEPFRSKFLGVLKRLEMARFTRRHPKLLSSLLRQFLTLAGEFEGELLNEQAKQSEKKQSPQKQAQKSAGGGGDENRDKQSQQEGQEGCEGSKGQDQQDPSGESEQADERGEAGGEAGSEQRDIQLQLEEMDGGGQVDPSQDAGNADDAMQQGMSDFAERLAEEMLKKMEEDWAPAMEALEIASATFEDVDALLEGPEGFDSSSSVWRQGGWREVAALKKRLEDLRELRDLVRSLGRGGGKGPLRKAPQQVYKPGNPMGVIRTEQSPEETGGLTRSGDLSRILPMEAHLLAAGWPARGERGVVSSSSSLASNGVVDDLGNSSELPGEEEEGSGGGGSRACRLLFMARRAERQLMSYERTGWTDDEPSRVTGRLEMRPAAELGPIIVCLDTSGSMMGPRETVAKALTLECMRGAYRQGRKCFLYAFSGPNDVMQLELGNDAASMSRLLPFLTMSFSGGTDVDAPLALSLERLSREEWELADILMVTDGEIPPPDEDIMLKLRGFIDNKGLEVHGLLVGRNVTDPMKELCTHLHVFKSWSAVSDKGYM